VIAVLEPPPPLDWRIDLSKETESAGYRDVEADAKAVAKSALLINAVFDELPAGAREIDLDLAIGAACPFSHWRETEIWLYVFRRIAWQRGWRWRGLDEQVQAQIAGEARD
jgi:hypothetical protein